MCLFVAIPSGANGGGTTSPSRALATHAACPPLPLTRNRRTKRVAPPRGRAISFFASNPSDSRLNSYLHAQLDDTESLTLPDSSHRRVRQREPRPAYPTLWQRRHTTPSRRKESRAAFPKPVAGKRWLGYRAANRDAARCSPGDSESFAPARAKVNRRV